MVSLFLFILLISLYLQVYSTDLSFEQTVLLNLKQHWGNPHSLDSWNSTPHLCDWRGVECTSGAVTRLYLAEKDISGTIPSAICQLQNLVKIDLSKNNMSGHIPVGLSNCSNLEYLDLSLNKLSEAIPGELFLMKRLLSLHLYGNGLSGEIPTPMEAHSLESLDLSNNHLSGTIPDDVRNLYNLLNLDLSMNALSGAIPKGLFHMHQLCTMSLGHNNLSGYLPTEFDLFSLQVLNLTHNSLNGTVPKSLGELPGLSAVDLSENLLSGDIIETVFHLKSKSILRLCSNKFLGKIPYEFVKQNFGANCLDHYNLCSDNRVEGLQSCPSNLCSNSRVLGLLECNSTESDSTKSDESKRHLVIIIVETVGSGVVGFTILYYLVRKCWNKKHWNITARCKKIWDLSPREDKEEWKMVSFQRQKFNKNEILSGLTDENLIGSGGSGKVYRVFINQTGNSVAVKSISNARKDHRVEKEFMAEIQTVGNVRHYNIVKLLCCISGKDLKLLVYQYFEKKSLDQWLHCNNSRLDWPMRLHIAIGVAQGLCYLHHDCSPPIIHRDIKSSNILLDSEFNAKIADFGLAKLLIKNGETETASAVAGTFGYIAPEYAYTTKLNTKTDVYSFGVVLLELTTKREAVTRGDHMNLAGWAQLLYRDTSAIIDALDAAIKESIYMDQIIEVFRLGVFCTATLPSNRPSMKDCLHILQNCRNNFPSSSPGTSQLSDHHPLLIRKCFQYLIIFKPLLLQL